MQSAQNPRLHAKVSPAKSEKETGWDYITCIPNGGLLGIILGVIISFVLHNPFFKSIGFGLVIGCGLGLILYTILRISKRSDQNQLNKKAEKVNEQIAEKNTKILVQVPQRTLIVKKEIEHAKSNYEKTCNTLQRYYAKNIIYEKYRSLVPICMFYEYLASGRCSQLEGHEGAYNLYESEVKMQIIITKLSDIIERLDRIEDNQYTIAVAIRQSQQEISNLSNVVQQQAITLSNIENDTIVSNYYNRIIEMNTSYLAWLAYTDR